MTIHEARRVMDHVHELTSSGEPASDEAADEIIDELEDISRGALESHAYCHASGDLESADAWATVAFMANRRAWAIGEGVWTWKLIRVAPQQRRITNREIGKQDNGHQ